MKHLKRFFVLVLCVLPCVAGANVATTAGSNLTAWNGNSGATNNNNWNTLMNNRTLTGGTTAKADFGNCNSLILRCAQPKCSACTTMELAVPVVSGCVNSSKDCKKHGDELVQYIAAQIVANAAAKLQEQQLAMQQAQAQAAAAQNSQQMAQMQQQMAQMQQEMQQQNATQMAQMQAALEEQKALVTQAQQEAAAAQQAKQEATAQTASGITVAQQSAAQAGINPDLLVREQAGGEILSALEDAEQNLKNLKNTMKDVFDYAGCDARGNNCSGPKRVKIFKEKARSFFEPYDEIADELYTALDTALLLGVDVNDILMMLNGSCNRWGRYMCHSNGTDANGNPIHKVARYAGTGDTVSCKNGLVPGSCINGKSQNTSCTDDDNVTYSVKGGFDCTIGMVVPPQDDALCTQIGYLSDEEKDGVYREWVDENYDGDRMVRLGCVSSVLDSVKTFSRRSNKKASTLDVDTLERILEQDSSDMAGSRYDDNVRNMERLQYCGLTVDGYRKLNKAVSTQKFSQKDVCIDSAQLRRDAINADWVRSVKGNSASFLDHIPEAFSLDSCKNFGGTNACWHKNHKKCYVRGQHVKDDKCVTAGSGIPELGKFNYWNGASVVTEQSDVGKCLVRGGRWLTKEETEIQKYTYTTGKDGCCIISQTETDLVLCTEKTVTTSSEEEVETGN